MTVEADYERPTIVADQDWAEGSPWWGGGRWVIRLINITDQPVQVGQFNCDVPTSWSRVTDGNSKLTGVRLENGHITARARKEAWANNVPAGGELTLVLECYWTGQRPGGTPTNVKINGKPVTFDYDTPPTVPAKLRATRALGRSIQLQWDAAEDKVAVLDYLISCEGEKPGWTVPSRTTAATVTSPTGAGLAPNRDYRFRVKARNVANLHSGWSDSIVVNSGEPAGDRDAWDVPVMPFIDYAGTSSTTATEGQSRGYNQITPIAEDTSIRGVSLGFITMNQGTSVPCWGAQPTLNALDGKHNKDDVEAFRKLNPSGAVVISMGGWDNYIPEALVTDEYKVLNWYTRILGMYGVNRVDFDIEGGVQDDEAFIGRHTRIVTALLSRHPQLRISYTLPVDAGREARPHDVDGPDNPNDTSDPTPELKPSGGFVAGFNRSGKKFLRHLAASGITPSLVNGMTMTMGNHDLDQGTETIIALRYMHRDLALRFPWLDTSDTWTRLGACPMFGINDGGEVFTLEDMRELVEFANTVQLGCVSGWSANRDWHSNRPEERCGVNKGDKFNCTWQDQTPGQFLNLAAERTDKK